MTARLAGKVAFITGAARGQGRSHAVRLAEEGASIIAVDACAPIATVPYPLPGIAELDLTRSLVEAAGGSIITRIADVRQQSELDQAVAAGIDRFGRIDIIVANAGINGQMAPACEIEEHAWQTVIDIDLSGVWRTVKAAAPAMATGERGGSIILISSVGGAKGFANVAPYIAAKHGLIGLMRSLAREMAPQLIRVNAVLPTNVDTPMLLNDALFDLVCRDVDNPTLDDVLPRLQAMNAMPVPWVESIDVSNAVLWLASDEARYVTGAALPVDAGALLG
jgi:(+)-trans-carveol dehydrogenase